MRAPCRLFIAVLAFCTAAVMPVPAVAAQPADAAVSVVAADPVAGAMVSVTPTRVADSRTHTQLDGPIAAHGVAAIRVAGLAAVPSTAAMVVATLTVVSPSASGHLVVWPAGSARPATSNLNFAAGQSIANTVIVPVGTDGRVQVFNAAAAGVAVVVDLTGYVRGGSATKPGTVVAVPAARIADGRTALQIGAVPAVGTAAVRVTGLAGIPVGASQVILTVTVVRPSTDGFLVAWQSGAVRPEVTTMNFQAGRNIAATAVVPAGPDGKIMVYNGSPGTAVIVVDVQGYVLAGPTSAAGAVAAVTARIADTRRGLQIARAIPAGSTAEVQVAAPRSDLSAAFVTVTAVGPTKSGHLIAWRSGTSRPHTANLNFQAGRSISISSLVTLGTDGKILLYNGSSAAVPIVVDIRQSVGSGTPVRGAVWTWGDGRRGQLGNGDIVGTTVPVRVFGLNDVIQVAGGFDTGYALRSDGTVWSWGTGAFGQSGTGAGPARRSPVPLRIPDLDDVTAIAAGAATGYALRSDNTVWAWGDGSNGRLGDGDDERYSTVPVQVAVGQDAVAVAGGNLNGYAVRHDGTVSAWGSNVVGGLGNPIVGGVTTTVSGLTGATAVATGGQTTYAVLADHTVWGWGDGSWGQLDGALPSGAMFSDVPLRIGHLTGVSAAAGASFTGYALLADGTVRAWGEDHYGELGNGGSNTDSAVPVPVSVSAVRAIAGGNLTGYALRDDGTVFAWGAGSLGQLGNGRTADSWTPVPARTPAGVIAIAGGGATGFAVAR
jgi:alpha-tubulin suppressor-like RCC1 family protein